MGIFPLPKMLAFLLIARIFLAPLGAMLVEKNNPQKISVQGKILWPRRASHQSGWHAGEFFFPPWPRWGEPLKVGGLCRFVSFLKGSIFSFNMLGISWVYKPRRWPTCWHAKLLGVLIFASRSRCHDQLPNHLQVHFVVWKVARVIDPWEGGRLMFNCFASLFAAQCPSNRFVLIGWLVDRDGEGRVHPQQTWNRRVGDLYRCFSCSKGVFSCSMLLLWGVPVKKNWTMPERETVSVGCQRAILSIHFFCFTPVLDHASPNLIFPRRGPWLFLPNPCDDPVLGWPVPAPKHPGFAPRPQPEELVHEVCFGWGWGWQWEKSSYPVDLCRGFFLQLESLSYWDSHGLFGVSLLLLNNQS